ncbi:unnamed protein product [Trifolium pratense]|uniref:Uncharacterized protein n=1 Tax=Trifolium pratense TaxID=57577 RepID=A0ACB0KEP2_TRIPR|nr:unnamed protein product [Trifolium pratense]
MMYSSSRRASFLSQFMHFNNGSSPVSVGGNATLTQASSTHLAIPAGVGASVTLMATLLQQVQLQDALVLEAIQRLWKSDVPSKVNVFGWRLLLNRLPTRTALHHRGILTNHHELSCVFCFQQAEDENHLFFSCPFSKGVWNKVLSWLGTSLQTGVEGRDHFLLFGDLFKMKDKGRVRYLVWLATTWNISNLRNKVIFKGNIPDVSSLLETIKLHSWLWLTSRYGRKTCIPFPF